MKFYAKIILVIIILVILGGGIFWVWNKWTGRFKIGADAIIGCQAPGLISNFMGQPGSNLVTYNLFGNEVSVNEKLTPFLDNIQKEVNAANTGYSFDNIQTYNYRGKIGGGGLSTHSWGIAIDINPDRNPYQLGNWGAPETDIPPQIIDIFKKYGFQWGGDWAGQRDAMHFEWYGSEISGNILDANSGQIITNTTIEVNKSGAPIFNGHYDLILEATHKHEILAQAKGYEDSKFEVELFCFQSRNLDITLKPLPDNLGGSVSGKVSLVGNRPPVIPATIYLDGLTVGASNVTGDYIIPNVKRGKHKVEAKILFFPGNIIETTDMVPGENIQNLNITIGK